MSKITPEMVAAGEAVIKELQASPSIVAMKVYEAMCAASPKKGRLKEPPLPGMEFPTWWPSPEWNGFVTMRKRIRAPLTEEAIWLCVKQLTELKTSGHDPCAIINQSIQKSWRGLFPIGGKDVQVLTPAAFENTTPMGWEARLCMFMGYESGSQKGTWSEKWGPQPGAPECRVPPACLVAFRAKYGRQKPRSPQENGAAA